MDSTPDVLGAGPVRDRTPSGAAGVHRRFVLVAAAVGLVMGVVGAHALDRDARATPSRPVAQASATAAAPALGDASAGVVVPEVVHAQTLPGSNDLEVVAEAVPGASTPGPLRYDYSLVGAPWLAPDGTVRSGPPGCPRGSDEVQYLQVAVVHARAVAGGPDLDRVVWYRCGSPPAGVVLPGPSFAGSSAG